MILAILWMKSGLHQKEHIFVFTHPVNRSMPNLTTMSDFEINVTYDATPIAEGSFSTVHVQNSGEKLRVLKRFKSKVSGLQWRKVFSICDT